MSQKTLQHRLIELLCRIDAPMTPEVASIHLEVPEADVARELNALFLSSRVEWSSERGAYRVVPR